MENNKKYTFDKEDKAAILNLLDKLKIQVNSHDIKDSVLDDSFEMLLATHYVPTFDKALVRTKMRKKHSSAGQVEDRLREIVRETIARVLKQKK